MRTLPASQTRDDRMRVRRAVSGRLGEDRAQIGQGPAPVNPRSCPRPLRSRAQLLPEGHAVQFNFRPECCPRFQRQRKVSQVRWKGLGLARHAMAKDLKSCRRSHFGWAQAGPREKSTWTPAPDYISQKARWPVALPTRTRKFHPA